jgi:hypothetical protein
VRGSRSIVYAIQSDATQDNAAVRSRNLFWRIWSSPTLTRSITPPRLTRLWQQCSQEFDLTPIGGIPALPRSPVLQVKASSRRGWSSQLMMITHRTLLLQGSLEIAPPRCLLLLRLIRCTIQALGAVRTLARLCKTLDGRPWASHRVAKFLTSRSAWQARQVGCDLIAHQAQRLKPRLSRPPDLH